MHIVQFSVVFTATVTQPAESDPFSLTREKRNSNIIEHEYVSE